MNKRWLIAILLLAASARALLFLSAPGPKRFETDDTFSYWALAATMYHFGSFSDPLDLDHTIPHVFRTPGYPAFAISAGKVFQAVEGRENSVTFSHYMIPAQIVFDAALVLLTCWLGAMLAGPRVGLMAGFLQAISPLAVGASCRLLSDSLYAFVFTAAVLFMVAYLRGGRLWTLAPSAIALGAACYVRPIAEVMAPIFAIVVLLRPQQSSTVTVSAEAPASENPKPEGLAFISPGRSPGCGPPEEDQPCKGGITSLSRPFRAPNGVVPDTQGFALGWRIRAFQALTRITARTARVVLFLALFAACIAPWVIRNGVRANYWGFSSVFGDTLFHFSAPEVMGHLPLADQVEGFAQVFATQPGRPPSFAAEDAQIPSTFEVPRDSSSWSGWLDRLGEPLRRDANITVGAAARWRQRKALEIISCYPWTYARLHAKGCLAFWLPSTDVLEIAGLTRGGKGTLGVLHEKGPWAAAKNYFGDDWRAIALAVPIALFTLVQYLGGVLGSLRGARRARWRVPAECWLLVLIVLASCLASGTTGVPRFRVPVEPIINLAAAAGLLALFRRKGSARLGCGV